MSDRDQRIAESIAYLEFIKANHLSYMNAAHRMQDQFETAAKQGKPVASVHFEVMSKDDTSGDMDIGVLQNYLMSAVAGSASSQGTMHEGASGTTTSVPTASDTTENAPNAEKEVKIDPRTEYYNRQIELIKSMQNKKK